MLFSNVNMSFVCLGLLPAFKGSLKIVQIRKYYKTKIQTMKLQTTKLKYKHTQVAAHLYLWQLNIARLSDQIFHHNTEGRTSKYFRFSL